MKNTFTFSDILPYGSFQEGILRITNDFTLALDNSGEAECMLVSAYAMFEGDTLPTIQFAIVVDGQETDLYASPFYTFGKRGEFTMKEWRIPPLFRPDMKAIIRVVVPEGTVLSLRSMASRFSAHTKDWNGGLRHNSHLGFLGMAPDNTMPALELAAKCGYPACIVVPKVTADGILVCIHDDTINRHARDAEGNPPEKDMTVWDYTYEELLKWDYGVARNPIYKGTRLPLLSDFFDLCARTGMRPMFSTHPGLTIPQWEQVKDMLTQRGLLKSFHIKSFYPDVLKTAWQIFGTSIDGYTRDSGSWNDTLIPSLLDAGIDPHKSRVGVEIPFRCATAESTRAILDAGMFAAVYSVSRTTSEEYRRLMSYGVTEFTEDHHCSMGLNW